VITLEALILKFQEFVTNHQILNSWYFGNPYERLTDGQSIQYPMMFGMLQPSRLGAYNDKTVIRLYIADRVSKNKANAVNVISDTKLLAKDLLSYLKGTHWNEHLILNEDITLNPFFESFDDEVDGWWFDIEIKTKFEWDLCSVPITGQPSQTNQYSSFIVDQDGNILATLVPGQTYTVEQLQEIIQTLGAAPVTIIQTLT
jgi:hypothetical protein